jgi:hypothetical protein
MYDRQTLGKNIRQHILDRRYQFIESKKNVTEIGRMRIALFAALKKGN